MAGTLTLPNPIKELFKAGKPALGMNIRVARTPDIARIAKTCGHDFIFIDGQHSVFSVETVSAISQAALGCGIAPLVRVRSCDDENTQVILDNGAMGIVFPDVNTADQARRAVRRAKFPPIGTRSVSGGYPHFDYRPLGPAETVPALNENTLVVVMVETEEGLNNVEAIAEVPGVDVIHVGSDDLLTAMGKPGTYGSPLHLEAMDRVIKASLKHGKVPGLGGDRNVARQVEFIRKGVRFLTTNSDIAFMLAEGSRVTGELRKALT